MEKRQALHRRRINLVEIDLLLSGHRPPMKAPLRPGEYAAIVTRGPDLPRAALYAWTVRHRLPEIPIPLLAPDPDVPIDLQELVDRVYDLGRYRLTLRYDRPLPESAPLHADERSWLLAAGQGS